MNASLRLIVLALAGICLFAPNASGQVDPYSDLTYISPNMFRAEAPPDIPDMVFRNRYEGQWLTAQADFLVMDRVGPRSVPLLRDTVSGAEVLNANDIDFTWQYGPRVNFILHEVLFGQDVEVGYFQIDGYRGSATVESTGDPIRFAIPGYSATATSGQAIRFDYPSRIYSAEINGRIYLFDRLALLAGFRWFNLHENLYGSQVVEGATSQFLDINTDNHLYGGQIGLDVSLFNNDGPFRIDGVLKAGVYGNFADQTVLVGTGNYGDKRDHTAFVGELNLVAVYEITPDLLLRGGYQVMWLEGVALAGDQPATLDLFGNLQPDTGGSLFYHGAFAGLEFNY